MNYYLNGVMSELKFGGCAAALLSIALFAGNEARAAEKIEFSPAPAINGVESCLSEYAVKLALTDGSPTEIATAAESFCTSQLSAEAKALQGAEPEFQAFVARQHFSKSIRLILLERARIATGQP